MKTQFYFPAPVEVVKVTNENLADVAAWCGGKVASTESRRVPGRQDSYVWVPTPKGNSISWAFPGMYITKRLVVTVKDEMKETFAVFRRDYFSRNYFDTPTEATNKTWEKQFKKDNPSAAPKPAAPKPRPSYKSKAELDAEIQQQVGLASVIQKENEMEEIIPDAPTEVVSTPKFRHNHNHTEVCGDGCADVNIEAVHIFNDIRIDTTQDHQEEEDMKLNENNVPEFESQDEADEAELKQLQHEEDGTAEPANPQDPQYIPVEPGSNLEEPVLPPSADETTEAEPATPTAEELPVADAVTEDAPVASAVETPSSEIKADDISSGEKIATGTPVLTEESPFSKAGDAEKSDVVNHGSDGFNAGTTD